ncbi:uncharacterized protein LOC103380093 isoform X2 [Cynoglossus semilaevis]|uniref:uncharacterized protein LOC103380093 isoform X2 n=1 Tax=Cynoglossus semilaevis TaxID=244447 RepID=UPI000D62402C|nr:uncharacterized protein LOC103380093 isoform X2 [Cynoglossus semilaevis]
MKYDVVNRLLFVEMLQEHYTQSLWETMQPWQQHKEKEELEDHAVEALEAGDMLHLATLPGAFRMYRVNLGAEFREESWSAVSLLCDIYIYREQERDELTGLGEWLDRESLKVLCLYVMVAMLKVCREKVSYSALLAARQSWKAWPQVSSPGREEQASLWLCGEDEHSENLMSASPQQAELQLLALTQDLEKRQLVKLLHEISLDNLEENQQLTALRNVCTERLRQIQSGQQRGTEYGTLAENANAEAKLHPRPQIPTGVCREGVLRPQYALRECAMLLLTQLQQIHDVKAVALLQQLTHKNKKRFQNTQSENESKLLMEVKTDLLQVLSTGHHLTSDLMSSGNGTDQIQGSGSGPAFSLSVASDQKTDGEINVQASADETAKLQVRKDCGSDMEEMPYLEILCVPDSTSERHRSSTIEEHGTRKESEDNSAGLQTYEKQGSLITFAWSKQPYEDEANETEETVVVIEQSRDRESGVETLQQKDKSEEVCDERFNVGPERCVPTGPLEADEQVLKERAMEPISAMVREKTIQNLVDIQRKVEQKQQREKERQLLRKYSRV